MMKRSPLLRLHGVRRLVLILALGSASASLAQPALAQVPAFQQAVAESASRDADLAAFYRDRSFTGVWTGDDSAATARRNALLAALADAGAHGLPIGRHDPDHLMAQLRAATTPAQQGAMDVALSAAFLQYARDVQTGILTPAAVVPLIVRDVPLRDRMDTLTAFLASNPAAFLRSLPPRSPEYARLMREKLRMEHLLNDGGFGPTVQATRLAMGDSGNAVIELRNRLMLLGHLDRTATGTYDAAVQAAVIRFQASVGLTADGTAGPDTLDALNTPLEQRMQSVIVAMERERWMNMPRGQRHIWVNLTDFTAAIVDDDRVTFSTRSVIGASDTQRQSPEFSDSMEYMVVNPSWYVPRSIIVGEYLPQLQSNPGAVAHLDVTDRNGNIVPRSAVRAASYTARTFPYAMRQAPSPQNALGLVKFMFPNEYNIYLHDTPSKNLFSRDTRAFSHGCIRLNDPFDFAYALLAKQESDPEALFQSRLRTGAESRINLTDPVPVHIVYRTAFTDVAGRLQFRRDVYGRDAAIWDALSREGVAVQAVQG